MVKCPGVIGWKANARPPGWKVRGNAPLLPGGGGWALLELTDALCHFRLYFWVLLIINQLGVLEINRVR